MGGIGKSWIALAGQRYVSALQFVEREVSVYVCLSVSACLCVYVCMCVSVYGDDDDDDGGGGGGGVCMYVYMMDGV